MSMIEERDYAVAATIGTRRRQEDCSGVDDQLPMLAEGAPGLLAIVADGMGGAPAGDQAGHIVVNGFLESFFSSPLRAAADRLRSALVCANEILASVVRERPGDFQGTDGIPAGCTLIAALFFQDHFCWISVGDSYIFRFRADSLELINPLHVFAVDLDEKVRRKEISIEFARNHPDRASLTSAVCGGTIAEIDQGSESLLANDILLLCTDGIDTLDESEVTEICQFRGASARDIAETIIERVNAARRKAQDNATVFVIRRGVYA
ncbi:MAG: serine/threonine-protein phosphatase [Gammaproteobacteria bacterium]|nr:serine/threonine-protein phosphatase [Gammaproteobacteria bacterium]MYE29770.1 serine/threonine-protein phosphatase [Gammaproteobacteria bacterium]